MFGKIIENHGKRSGPTFGDDYPEWIWSDIFLRVISMYSKVVIIYKTMLSMLSVLSIKLYFVYQLIGSLDLAENNYDEIFFRH